MAGRFIRKLRRISRQSVSLRLIAWALLVGAIGGAIVSMFRWVLGQLLHLAVRFYRFWPSSPWVLAVAVIVMLALGFAIAALIASQPLISGSGIPDVERRLRTAGPVPFPWWDVLWKKVVGGILAIGPGAFAGREGPSIQMSACVGLGVSHATTTTRRYTKELVAAGAAAGLSAAFNAPVAAVLFVTEEIYGRFSLQIGLSSFAAALVSDAVSQQVFGLSPVFIFPNVTVPPIGDYWKIVLLAIVLGLFAWLYEVTLLRSGNVYERLHIPGGLRPFVPLLATIPVGIWCPVLLGGGNMVINTLGSVRYALPVLVGYLIVRFLLSQLTYGSGSPGGIFLPILTLGALTGAAWNAMLGNVGLSPDMTSGTALMVVVGMAALFGAVSKAPLTAIILVTEMTSYGVLMPLACATFIAYLVYDMMGGKPIYDALGERHARSRRHRPGRMSPTTADARHAPQRAATEPHTLPNLS